MKPPPPLSDLVTYRQKIQALTITEHVHEWLHVLGGMLHAITADPAIRFKRHNGRIQGASDVIVADLDAMQQAITALRHELDDLIKSESDRYFAESTRLFVEEMFQETNEYILSRVLNIGQEAPNLVAHLLRYNDWRVPGLVIRPGKDDWIDHLVALDPLYIADQNMALLQPALDRFPMEYQRRLRPYTLDDRSDTEILSQLPNEQFGFIFCYNFFNYRPMELVQRYLQEILFKLRPGGILFFTFNDCDRGHNVALVERKFMCYTPGTLVRHAAETMGYEVITHHIGDADCAWMELRRPGKLRSIKGAQTLAKIMPRSK